MSRKHLLPHKKRATHPPPRRNAHAERYRRRRINLWHKIVDLYDLFGVHSYIVLKDDKNTWELNSDPARPGWPPTVSVSGSTGRRICLTMDECRRRSSKRRPQHLLPRACKSGMEEEKDGEEGGEEEDGEDEEEEGEEECEEDREEDGKTGKKTVGGSPASQGNADGGGMEEMVPYAGYQEAEVAEAAVPAEEAASDHLIEKRVRQIQDMWEVPESPKMESTSFTNGYLTSHTPATTLTSTVREVSSPPIVSPSTCPSALVTPPVTPQKSVRINRRVLDRWRSLAAIKARQSAWRSFSDIMKHLEASR